MQETIYKLLIVDDDPLIHQSIKAILPAEWKAISVLDANDVNYHFNYSAAFIDMHLKPGSREPLGLQVVKKLSQSNPSLEIYSMSGDLELELMEAGLKNGAKKFLAKPLFKEEVIDSLGKIESLIQIRQLSLPGRLMGYIGNSQIAEGIRHKISQMKSERGPILIEGESGTGKEVVASLLYKQEKTSGAFVSINMAAISEHLFESELFGHIKGAFTGADQTKIGLIEAAAGGDLFLDEIEALSLVHQAKLLRFLESGEIKKVGAKDPQTIQCRVIVATNQNLESMVSKGDFREDLLFRISGKKISLPSLRERKEDISVLANHFLGIDSGKRKKQLNPDAIDALEAHHWPGNVRELKRVCEQLSILSPLPIIRREDVEKILKPPQTGSTVTPSGKIDLTLGFDSLTKQYEKEILIQGLDQYKDVDQLTQVLGLSRSSIYKKIKDFKIDV